MSEGFRVKVLLSGPLTARLDAPETVRTSDHLRRFTAGLGEQPFNTQIY